jgi:hypothetical protein
VSKLDLVDGTHGALTSTVTAATLAQGHPKSGIPEKGYRPGRALDSTSSAVPQPGIGVGGALPIGAFQA